MKLDLSKCAKAGSRKMNLDPVGGRRDKMIFFGLVRYDWINNFTLAYF